MIGETQKNTQDLIDKDGNMHNLMHIAQAIPPLDYTLRLIESRERKYTKSTSENHKSSASYLNNGKTSYFL